MAENIRRLTEADLAPLERMCDDYSLYEVLWALSRICHEKAEHIDQSYSTGNTSLDGEATRWRKRGLQVQATAEYLERLETFNTLFEGSAKPVFTGRLKR